MTKKCLILSCITAVSYYLKKKKRKFEIIAQCTNTVFQNRKMGFVFHGTLRISMISMSKIEYPNRSFHIVIRKVSFFPQYDLHVLFTIFSVAF